MSNSRPKRKTKRSTKLDDFVSDSVAGKNNKNRSDKGEACNGGNVSANGDFQKTLGGENNGMGDKKCCSEQDMNNGNKDTVVTEVCEVEKEMMISNDKPQNGMSAEGTSSAAIDTHSDSPDSPIDVANKVTGCKSPNASSSMLKNIDSTNSGNINAESPNSLNNANYADKLNNNMDTSANKLFQIPTVLNEDGYEYGVGRLGYARVLVEEDASKGLSDSIEVLYKSKVDGHQFMKKVQVVYDWEPPVCSHCKVFGHSYEACLKRVRTEETTKEKQADVEGFVQANKRKDNNVPGSSKVPQQPKSNLPKEKPKGKPNVMYQQKVRQDVGSSKPAENVNVNAQKAQSSSPRKAYNVGKEAMQAIKNTANKYAILGEQEEDVEVLSLSNQDKEIVDKYVEAKSKPSETVVGKWKQGMLSYFIKSWKTKYGKERMRTRLY
ncbi:hypothetical protein CTI12_AA216660 [Artemisia annua]|uniref:Zinc knuckle CX2CX4HX4C n=1 Tax=Artemisia annua TaxID=35608 RepID=A0A2U1NY11_ARTAN|nr:hypothetical protein CTI12_AA216660 [Artemisia annua]